MKVATGLASGHTALPELARDAVTSAMASAGLNRADHVLLLLSRDFARHAQPAVVAAARAGACLSVSGMTASGLLTEHGWYIDQPAAAALVIGDLPQADDPDASLIAFAGHGRLPGDWQAKPARAGLVDSDAQVWAHGRIAESACGQLGLPGLRCAIAHSTGLRTLNKALPASDCRNHELRRIGPLSAQDSLRRALPPECRDSLPLHQIALIRSAGQPAVAVLGPGPDGCLLITEPLQDGELVCWGIRQPLAAEHDMRASLHAGLAQYAAPGFALMFSCIGRGPLFYGDDDLDLKALREVLPGTPILGAYGTGQIVPLAGGNRLFHNSVLTLLFEKAHV